MLTSFLFKVLILCGSKKYGAVFEVFAVNDTVAFSQVKADVNELLVGTRCQIIDTRLIKEE